MTPIIIPLLLAGLLAGLVNYIIIIKKLQLPDAGGSTALTALMHNPSIKPGVLFWRSVVAYLKRHWELVGYMVVGIAGALLVPLFNVLFGPIKTTSPSGFLADDKNGQLALFGYGLIFGMFANTIFKDILGVLRGQMSNVQKDVDKLKNQAAGTGQAPAGPTAGKPAAPKTVTGAVVSEPASYGDIRNTGGALALNFVKGVDVSHYQSSVDWAALVREGIRFVYIKASDGMNSPDGMAWNHATTARQYQLKIGYYHFARPYLFPGGSVQQDAQDQVSRVKAILTGLPAADLPLVLDLEDDPGNSWDTNLSPAEYVSWVQAFMDAFATGTKMDPILYGSKSYFDQHLPAGHALGSNFKCWLARYSADYLDAAPPAGWAQWHIWQFSSKGVIGGNNSIDLDIWWRQDFTQY